MWRRQMTAHDKAAIGYSMGIVAVAVAIALYGSSEQTVSAPTLPVMPVEEPVEEPMEPMEETVDEPVEEPMAPVEEPMDEPMEAPAEETMEEPVEETMEEPMEETMEEPVEETMEEPVEETVEEPVEETVDEPVEEPSGPMVWEVISPEGTSVAGCEETDTCFIPSMLEISVGDTVAWYNNDVAAHTVTSGSPSVGPTGVFDSSLVMAGTVFEHTFEEAGTYDYFCLVHPWMIGTVQVN